MIEPTIGRIVWFYPLAAANPNGQPHAAKIAFVQDERTVNLAVVDENGTPYSRTSVKLLQDDDQPPADAPYATWMPYQKGQAAKTETAVAAADLLPRLEQLEKSTEERFRQTGDFLEKKFAEIEARLAQQPACPPPADPPSQEPAQP